MHRHPHQNLCTETNESDMGQLPNFEPRPPWAGKVDLREDSDSLSDLLSQPDSEGDLKRDSSVDANELLWVYPSVVAEGIELILQDESQRRRLRVSRTQRVATKQGLKMLRTFPEWSPTADVHGELVKRARTGDRTVVRFLEQKSSFKFARPNQRKMIAPIPRPPST